jgi:hypothetical protein
LRSLLKSRKDINQLLVDVIHAGGETLCSEIYKVIDYIWKNEKLPHQWKESILHLFIRRVRKLIAVIINT